MNSILSLCAKVREKGNSIIIDELKKQNLDDLCPSHGDILKCLFENEEVSMQDVARMIHKTKATTTHLVDKLEHKGFVERYENPNDSRSTVVSLTSKGKSLKPFFESVSFSLDSMFSNSLCKKEIETLENLLTKVVEQ